jgi:lipid-binding SYLF domain-containing protein
MPQKPETEVSVMRIFLVLRSGAIAVLTAIVAACSVSSSDRARLDTGIQHTMGRCQTLSECSEAADRAEGILVMPDITKAAVVLGGAYGEGGLVVDGKTTDYYSLVGTSIGLQLGYRERAAVIMFMTPSALDNFKANSGWDARRNLGLTAGHLVDDMEVVTALEVGLIHGAPAYIFVVEDSGLMADASWNGLKLTRMTVEP